MVGKPCTSIENLDVYGLLCILILTLIRLTGFAFTTSNFSYCLTVWTCNIQICQLPQSLVARCSLEHCLGVFQCPSAGASFAHRYKRMSEVSAFRPRFPKTTCPKILGRFFEVWCPEKDGPWPEPSRWSNPPTRWETTLARRHKFLYSFQCLAIVTKSRSLHSNARAIGLFISDLFLNNLYVKGLHLPVILFLSHRLYVLFPVEIK